jgi:hypothetical protein
MNTATDPHKDPDDPAEPDPAPPTSESSEAPDQDWLLDEALRETFPASDPISPAKPRTRPT